MESDLLFWNLLALPALLIGMVWYRTPVLRLLRETTLIVPLVWLIVACVGIAIAGAVGTMLTLGQLSSLRFASACLALCPTMSLWGARRPHQHAWNMVVISLWLVLVLPAANHWLGRPLQLHATRQWLICGLIGLGSLNFLATRFQFSALIAAGAQLLLFVEFLWQGGNDGGVERSWRYVHGPRELIFNVLVLIAIAFACRKPRGNPDREDLDRLWLDFRDLFGALWALRVMERVNAVARQAGWPLQLRWTGFRELDPSQPIPPVAKETLKVTMLGMMRRFVSVQWVAERGFALVDDAE